MNILIAPDKFKGSLNATEVAAAIQQGILQSLPDAQIRIHPMADGGEGSLDILASHLELTKVSVFSLDPLGRKMKTYYYMDEDAAYIELAAASGLQLLSEDERNPLLTSTYGTGLTIAHAMQKEIERIYLFVGGSATNDGGIGILSALGFKCRDANGDKLDPIGSSLNDIATIQRPLAAPYDHVEIIILTDVNNPLCGPTGAAQVYAAQKGATVEVIDTLDHGLANLATIITNHNGMEVAEMPGIGAAGGVAAGLVGLIGARLQSGITTLADLTELPSSVAWADVIITGEGRADRQSLHGKVIEGVLSISNSSNKHKILVTGECLLSEMELSAIGVCQQYDILSRANGIEDAMRHADLYLKSIGENIGLSLQGQLVGT